MMDALEFAREMKRMCSSNIKNNKCRDSGCEAYQANGCTIRNLEKLLPIVEKWSKEHPFIRNVDHVAEGLEKLGYRVNKEKIANDCPPQYNTLHCWSKKSCTLNCKECSKWWLEEYKGEENDSQNSNGS